MKMKLLSIFCGLVVALALVGCDTSEQATSAPDEATSTPDVETPGETGGFQAISTFTAGIGTPISDSATVSQAAFNTISAGISGINVCGPGLSAGSGCTTACGYDPAAYGGNIPAPNEAEVIWTLNNCTGGGLECMGVQYIGIAPDCTTQALGPGLANGDVGNVKYNDPQAYANPGAALAVTVRLNNVETAQANNCHYQFQAGNDYGNTDTICTNPCGNGSLDVGEDCDPGIDPTCCTASCTFVTAGTDPAGDCDDADACTTESCDGAGGCTVPAPITCDDGVACTTDGCDSLSGCTVTPVDAACDDADMCTTDTCDQFAGCANTLIDACDGMWCPGETAECDGGANCTACTCDAGSTSLGDGSCGVNCGNGSLDAGEACDDGALNGTTTCGCDITCQYPGGATACGDPTNDACTNPDTCDGAGGCAANDEPVGTSCADGDLCNGDETCDGSGTCTAGTPLTCDDGVPCTIDGCDAGTGCTVTPDDTACDNGLACDGAETCDPVLDCLGGTPVDCSDADTCTNDVCSEPGGTCTNPLIDACDGMWCPGESAECDGGVNCTGCTCDAGFAADGSGGCPTPIASDFCATATIAYDPGCSPKPETQTGSNLGVNSSTCVTDGTVAYTAVVNRGVPQAGGGLNGDFVDTVRGTITSTMACVNGDTYQLGYTGASARSATVLDTSLCDGSTTFSMDFAVPGPYLNGTGELEFKSGGTDGDGQVVPLASALTSTESINCTHVEGDNTPYAIASDVRLANDGGMDADCSIAGGTCKTRIFAYCDNNGGVCQSSGGISFFPNRGYSSSRVIGVFDAAVISGIQCNGDASGPCGGQYVVPEALDYNIQLQPAQSRCNDATTPLTVPANSYVQEDFAGTTPGKWQGLMNFSACPLGVGGGAAAGATTTIDFVDLTDPACAQNASDAYFFDNLTMAIISCDDTDIFGAGENPIDTSTASAVITFTP